MARTFIVVGLAYGDEGKGSWVDHLVRDHGIRYVVRSNGGVQANHNVVTPDGRTHGFAQLNAGSFIPGTTTVLSRFMLTEPEALLQEAQELEQLGVDHPLTRVTLSENAPIITPFNRLLNRIQEMYRGRGKHGSCGMGIGLTQRDVEVLKGDALYVRDLATGSVMEKLERLQALKLAEAEQFANPETAELIEKLRNCDLSFYAELFNYFYRRVEVVSDEWISEVLRNNDSVFEGAQGVLLDQQYGFFPHCTRSFTTFRNPEQLLNEAGFEGQITRIGLLRGYGTRHGAGPFVTEAKGLDIPPCHNHSNLWQGNFRTGWFDAVSARYALKVVGGVDLLAITNLDRMSRLERVKYAESYDNVDPRYFENGRTFRVLNEDITTLGPRCGALDALTVNYREIPGWGTATAGIDGYLALLEAELDHPIKAYSTSIAHHKTYR